ncbi:HdeD family acid-resistance protein [Rhodovulum strictum]|uniref:HdeD family acid-resistance protein n=1 Tax=Rhodovulum strictum TaxID=58314 RepID=A0A844BJZ8_9RHOB|nr:DUF308 domain-containing protein [Rhodovulum strictum]MRH22798.1 hypothetical protein [Rhodovulum strictum]
MTSWFLWLIVGILSVIAGFVAFANPFAATLTATLMAGFMFTAIGLLTLFSAFRDQGWPARIWAFILGVLLTLFGINLIANPLEGVLGLTFAVAILLMVIGVLRIIIAFTSVAEGTRSILVVSGLLSIVLSAMIFANYPWSSAVVLGVFLAVELISNGVSMIYLALDRRAPKNA